MATGPAPKGMLPCGPQGSVCRGSREGRLIGALSTDMERRRLPTPRALRQSVRAQPPRPCPSTPTSSRTTAQIPAPLGLDGLCHDGWDRGGVVPHRGGVFAFSFMDRKKGRKRLEVGGGLADVVGKMRCRERIPEIGCWETTLSYGHPWAHYSGGYQDRLLGGPLGLL
jgi:hypothetical protein